MSGSHYSPAFEKTFSDSVAHAARQVAEFFEQPEYLDCYPVLCYTGFSGITIATLLAHHLRDSIRVEQLYVRKEGEQSHGEAIEYSSMYLEDGVPVFVDDFFDSGATANHVMKSVLNHFQNHYSNRHLIDWQYFFNLYRENDDYCDHDNGIHNFPFVLVRRGGRCANISVEMAPDLWYY